MKSNSPTEPKCDFMNEAEGNCWRACADGVPGLSYFPHQLAFLIDNPLRGLLISTSSPSKQTVFIR